MVVAVLFLVMAAVLVMVTVMALSCLSPRFSSLSCD